MDPQKLIDLLRATMEQQPEQRKAAEDQLTQVEIFSSTTWHKTLTLSFHPFCQYAKLFRTQKKRLDPGKSGDFSGSWLMIF